MIKTIWYNISIAYVLSYIKTVLKIIFNTIEGSLLQDWRTSVTQWVYCVFCIIDVPLIAITLGWKTQFFHGTAGTIWDQNELFEQASEGDPLWAESLVYSVYQVIFRA